MPTSAGVDTLLDRLLATTESLRDSARTFVAEQAADLLARRQQLASSLRSAIQTTGLTDQQREKLERAVQLGDEARESLLIKRETSRRELQEKLAGRHLSESFKPYRPKKLGSLNIKL
jgi:hypothetical protein